MYYVQFTDKDGSPYTLSEPTAYLSQRSIDRRTAKGIALDSLDLPVNPSYVQQAAEAVDATVRYTLRWLNGTVIASPAAIDVSTLTSGLYIVRIHNNDGTTRVATFSMMSR